MFKRLTEFFRGIFNKDPLKKLRPEADLLFVWLTKTAPGMELIDTIQLKYGDDLVKIIDELLLNLRKKIEDITDDNDILTDLVMAYIRQKIEYYFKNL